MDTSVRTDTVAPNSDRKMSDTFGCTQSRYKRCVGRQTDKYKQVIIIIIMITTVTTATATNHNPNIDNVGLHPNWTAILHIARFVVGSGDPGNCGRLAE